MNPRKPILALIAFGIAAAAALSFVPHALIYRFYPEPPVAASSNPSIETEGNLARRTKGEPLFDTALWYAERGELPETHGVLIESLSGDKVFAAHNAQVEFNPASLIKLSTSLVALRSLGAQYRFQTRVFATGDVDNTGTLRGRLHISGNDPTFGDAGAAIIAKALRERGIKRIAEGVSVSPDFSFNFSESPTDSAARLSRILRFGNPPTGVSDSVPASTPLLVFESYPLRDILLYMNARSSNFVAEHIGALVGGPEAVQQYLVNQLKLPAEQVTIERTSGREHNRMTASGLLTVIRALVDEAKRQGLEPEDIMAVASDDRGTLRRRLAGTGLEGSVVGKTGTLTSEVDGGMASLAGLVYTRDAGTIVFAILDQGNKISDNRQMEDQLLTQVVTMQTTMPRVVASPVPRQLLPPSELRIVAASNP
ncbi:MAG: D-alanyl-D-alanine carboxypeptidase [Pyrinomonadaceae bacterium]